MTKFFIFLFTLGLIFFARFDGITLLFQKIIIPLSFIFFFLKNPRLSYNTGILIYYLMFLLLALTSFVHTINLERTLRFFQLMIGSFMLLYIYVSVLTENPNLIKYIAFALVLSTFLFVITADGVNSQQAGREMGITSNPNLLGMFMLYGIFGVAILWNEYKSWKKIILALSIILSLYGIIVAASRKSLISTLVFISIWGIVIFLQNKSVFRLLLFGFFISIIAYVVYTFFYLDSILMFRLEYIEDSSEARYDIASEGFKLFKKSPLFGVGLGTFQEYSESGKYAHNDFFELIATLGILGVFIYFKIYKWILNLIYKVKKRSQDMSINYTLNVFIAIIISMIVLGFGRPHFFDIFSMSIFGIISGYTVGIAKKINHETRD